MQEVHSGRIAAEGPCPGPTVLQAAGWLTVFVKKANVQPRKRNNKSLTPKLQTDTSEIRGDKGAPGIKEKQSRTGPCSTMLLKLWPYVNSAKSGTFY